MNTAELLNEMKIVKLALQNLNDENVVLLRSVAEHHLLEESQTQVIRELQAELDDLQATNRIFSDCLRRSGDAYKAAHPEMDDNEWPDGAQALTWWVADMQARIEMKGRACAAWKRVAKKWSDEAWVTGQAHLVELGKSQKMGEEIDELQAQINALKARTCATCRHCIIDEDGNRCTRESGTCAPNGFSEWKEINIG